MSNRHVTGRSHDRAAPHADSCDSAEPPRDPRQVRRVLMRPVHRRVDTDGPIDLAGRVRVAQQSGMDRVPRSIGREAAMPLPRRLPRPERLRQIPPRRTGPIPPDDRLDHLPVVPKRPPTTSRRRWHQRLDPSPLRIRQDLIPHHPRSIPRPTDRVRRHALGATAAFRDAVVRVIRAVESAVLRSADGVAVIHDRFAQVVTDLGRVS